jgi:sigma-B regulation protein RsbU (phosphoserine phosphatase)
MKKDVEIEQLMSELNDHLHEHSTPDKFVTMILGRLGKDGSFNYVNAGHDFPVLFNEGGAREIVGDNDFPLGFFSGAKYHKRLAQIERGNVLLLYTDGISEAANREEMFGSGRLKEAVMDSMKLDSVSIARNVFNAMRDYKDCRDDRTLVVIKRCY